MRSEFEIINLALQLLSIKRTLSAGYFGSMGIYAAPDFKIPSMATNMSGVRDKNMPAKSPVPIPEDFK
jgi:hypothetical protein